MAGKTILIAGAGFGGLSATNELRARLGEDHRIIVIDRSRGFYLGFTKLWVMTGERPNVRANKRNRSGGEASSTSTERLSRLTRY